MRAFVLAALLLSGCASGELAWFDITGAKRGMPELKMAAATCELGLQNSVAGLPIPDSATSTPGLALGAVGAQMTRQSEYLEKCMMAQGWEERRVSAK